MHILLQKPELEQFVEEQVRAGNYPSVEAMIEAAISEAEDQADQGQGVDIDTFRAQINERMAGKR